LKKELADVNKRLVKNPTSKRLLKRKADIEAKMQANNCV
jgi:hypothetical protein